MEEIEIVSNQHMAMEMFLIRLMYLRGTSSVETSVVIKDKFNYNIADNLSENKKVDNHNINDELYDNKNKTIGQIKNVIQEKKKIDKILPETINDSKLQIKTFENLINLCGLKKEITLKHELETNVNLVSFENKRIEISFNEKLDKEFIKNLSSKLYEWTNDRWIISLSKKSGEPSKKEKEVLKKKQLLERIKKEEVYLKVLEAFPDAELIDVDINTNKNKNDWF